MHYTKKDIDDLDRIIKIKLINSVSGIKPANLIGSVNENEQTNLAIFSSVIHLGADPPLLGFIMRPAGEVPRHTFENILQNKAYTINHIHSEFAENAHYTSAKFDESISEFDRCNLTEEYITDFEAPFVKESNFKIGMRFKEAIDIKINNTILIIGEIEHLIIPGNAIFNNDVNLETMESIGISGLNTYYSLKKIGHYPYARENEVPDFY